MSSTDTHSSTHTAQRRLLTLARDLEKVDEALQQVVDSLDDAPGLLPREVASAADAVRRDLLADATDTLHVLARSSEATARARQLAVSGASEAICGP